MTRVLVLILIACAGCHPMPPGDVTHVQKSDVILLRGWRDLYSDGINDLAKELNAENYHASVYGQDQWHEVADALIARNATAGNTSLVLVGFSYGADHAIDVARKLNDAHIAVPLLITIDPVTPPKVPTNVAVCVNLYQSNGVWDIFPWFRGIPLKTDAGYSNVRNINVHDRPDLDDPNMAHKTITGYPAIHREIINQIKNYQPRDRM